MAAKKAAQAPTAKETATSTHRVVLIASSWQHKAGEVIEVDAATAKRLVTEGYALPA